GGCPAGGARRGIGGGTPRGRGGGGGCPVDAMPAPAAGRAGPPVLGVGGRRVGRPGGRPTGRAGTAGAVTRGAGGGASGRAPGTVSVVIRARGGGAACGPPAPLWSGPGIADFTTLIGSSSSAENSKCGSKGRPK